MRNWTTWPEVPLYLLSFFMTLLILKAPRVFHVAKLTLMVDIVKQKMMFSFPRVLITKYHKLGGFKQQKFMISQFWRIEVHNQSVSRTVFPLKDLGRNLPYAFFLDSGCWLAILEFHGLQLHNSTCLPTWYIFPVSSCGYLLIWHQSYWIRSLHYSSMTSF